MQRHRYLLVLAPILLSGCGIPPAITIASYVINGMSYAATGKSVSDHGISAAAGRDCATWRVIKGESICKGDPSERKDPAPVEDGQQATAPTGGPAPQVAGAPPASVPRQRYLLLGSFENRGTADGIASEFSDTKISVFEVRVSGRTAHRVVAGPLSDTEVAELRQRLVSHDGPRATEIDLVAAAPERSSGDTIERH
jgi:sporulation related protein